MVKSRAKRRATKRRTTTRKPKNVRLSPVGKAIKQKIKEMRKLDQTPQVTEAIGKMEESLAQLSQICGDIMIFPAS